MFTEWIASQVGDDPELLAKVMPDYPATGKRTLQDNGSWLRALTRDNVELVRDGDRPHRARRRRHCRRRAVRGRRHRLRDRLPGQPRCWSPMEIIGGDGDRPARRCGASGRRPTSASPCPGFPNFFCMYGPGTNLAHGGSLIFHSECQMRYITRLPRRADRRRTPHDGTAPGALRRLVRAVPGARSGRWCGRSRRSSTRSSRTRTARSTC